MRSAWRVSILLMLAEPMVTGLAHSADQTYVGSNKCKSCHLKEYKSWAETPMAKSFEVLKPGVRGEQKVAAGLDPKKDYTTDTGCLACHSTGYGKPGGFVNMATTPDRAGVGCETCHGPGGTYTQDQYMSLKNMNYKREHIVAAGMIGKINAEVCASECHNAKSPFVGKDYVFDFEARKNQGTHAKFALKYKH